MDQRTSTAVESLLSLSNTGGEDGQWRPPSPASSVSTDTTTFSPTRSEPAESIGHADVEQCNQPAVPNSPRNAQQPSRAAVRSVLASYCGRTLFTCVMQRLVIDCNDTPIN